MNHPVPQGEECCNQPINKGSAAYDGNAAESLKWGKKKCLLKKPWGKQRSEGARVNVKKLYACQIIQRSQEVI
jgi:hypothetical protein